MKIFVTAKPNSKNPRIEKIDETHFVVAVKELPKDGRANRAITKALAKYLHIARSQIELTSGATAKNKVFRVAT